MCHCGWDDQKKEFSFEVQTIKTLFSSKENALRNSVKVFFDTVWIPTIDGFMLQEFQTSSKSKSTDKPLFLKIQEYISELLN